MSLKKVILALIIVVSLLAIAGGLLGLYFINSNNNTTNITLDGDEVNSESFAVSLNNFYPTLTKNYFIKLRNDVTDDYKVKLQFEQVGDGKLGDYLILQVLFEGEEIASGTLSEFLHGESIELETKLSKSAAKIEIKFTMPQEIGNEGQNAAVDFNLTVSAER